VAFPELAAAVAFCDRQFDPADVPKTSAALLPHCAGPDMRMKEGWPACEAAMKAAGTRYEAYVYEGVNHGFHNDTTPRFDQAAADLAWERTLVFFEANLG
jgi:carboxymethylenebutenolidase